MAIVRRKKTRDFGDPTESRSTGMRGVATRRRRVVPRAAMVAVLGLIPVVGDYDGNGSADVAVHRPSTGVWYLYGPPFRATKWGEAGDIPLMLPHAIYQRFFSPTA